MKFLALKINRVESVVGGKFAAVAANIVTGVEAKGKLKRNKSLIISVTCISQYHFLAWSRTVFL